jgi:hypothetical protein
MPVGPEMAPPPGDDGGPPDGLPADHDGATPPPGPPKDGHAAKAAWQPFYTNYGPHVYVDADFLLWRFKPLSINTPLLTSGAVTNPPSAGFGILGNPTTSVVFGNSDVDFGQFYGARITVGGWLDGGFRAPCDRPCGMEVSYLVLGRQASHFTTSSDATGMPLLARPVVDTTTGMETALVVSAPGQAGATGSFNVNTDSELWGAEGNFFVPLIGKSHFMLGALIGARYVNFEEGLDVEQQTNVLGNGIAFFNGVPVRFPGGLAVSDNFETRNNFYGGQVGAQAALHWGNVSVMALGKIALGTMQQQVNAAGQTTLLAPGMEPVTTAGGLLALPSNSGHFTDFQFAVVSEGTATVTVQLTDKILVNVGYSILYLNNVVRPGDQIDRVVTPTQLPSSQTFNGMAGERPAVQFNRTDFWAHGLTVGLGLTF